MKEVCCSVGCRILSKLFHELVWLSLILTQKFIKCASWTQYYEDFHHRKRRRLWVQILVQGKDFFLVKSPIKQAFMIILLYNLKNNQVRVENQFMGSCVFVAAVPQIWVESLKKLHSVATLLFKINQTERLKMSRDFCDQLDRLKISKVAKIFIGSGTRLFSLDLG